MNESESDFRELEMNMDIIDEYYYGVRIFPGQDPSQVTTITILITYTSQQHKQTNFIRQKQKQSNRKLEVHGRARREAARRRKSEWKVNLDIRNSSRSNSSWRTTT